MIKNMNSKMTTNLQLSVTETKKKKTKQMTRTRTDSQKWRSHGGLSTGRGRRGIGEKVQRIRSITGRHKIDGERSKMV